MKIHIVISGDSIQLPETEERVVLDTGSIILEDEEIETIATTLANAHADRVACAVEGDDVWDCTVGVVAQEEGQPDRKFLWAIAYELYDNADS